MHTTQALSPAVKLREEVQTRTIFALRVAAISVFSTEVISTAQVAGPQGLCTQEASIEIGRG
jgi:hypothetical protein